MKDTISSRRRVVLDAYKDLIEAHLNSDQPYRFQTIIKLAKQAHELAKLDKIDVDAVIREFAESDRDNGDGTIGVLGTYRTPHATDGIREVIHQMTSLFERSQRDSDDKLLDRLGRVRDVLIDMGRPPESIAVIDQKIDQVVADMAAKEGFTDEVVHPKLLRGHSVDGEGQRQLRTASGTIDEGGTRRARDVPEERGQEGVDRQDDGSDARNGSRHRPWAAGESASVAGAIAETEP